MLYIELQHGKVIKVIKSVLIFLSVSDIITNFPQTLNQIIKFIEN